MLSGLTPHSQPPLRNHMISFIHNKSLNNLTEKTCGLFNTKELNGLHPRSLQKEYDPNLMARLPWSADVTAALSKW